MSLIVLNLVSNFFLFFIVSVLCEIRWIGYINRWYYTEKAKVIILNDVKDKDDNLIVLIKGNDMAQKVFIRKTDGSRDEIKLEPGEDILFKASNGNNIIISMDNYDLVRVSADSDLYVRPAANNSIRVSSIPIT